MPPFPTRSRRKRWVLYLWHCETLSSRICEAQNVRYWKVPNIREYKTGVLGREPFRKLRPLSSCLVTGAAALLLIRPVARLDSLPPGMDNGTWGPGRPKLDGGLLSERVLVRVNKQVLVKVRERVVDERVSEQIVVTVSGWVILPSNTPRLHADFPVHGIPFPCRRLITT